MKKILATSLALFGIATAIAVYPHNTTTPHTLPQPSTTTTTITKEYAPRTRPILQPRTQPTKPAIHATPQQKTIHGTTATITSGMAFWTADGGRCTLTAAASPQSGITARHCFGHYGEKLYNVKGEPFGEFVDSQDNNDIAYIHFYPGFPIKIDHLVSVPLNNGLPIYKYGSTTGYSEGTIIEQPHTITVQGPDPDGNMITKHTENAMTATLCSMAGDSGAPIYYKGHVIGMLSASDSDPYCTINTKTFFIPISAIK